VLDTQRRTFGEDPFPYGLEDNRPALETLAGYVFEQGLVRTRPAVDSLFAAAACDL